MDDTTAQVIGGLLATLLAIFGGRKVRVRARARVEVNEDPRPEGQDQEV